MFNFFEKLRDSENAPRERAAFVAALVLTAAIGAVWFSLLGGAPLASEAAPSEEVLVETVSVPIDTEGPISKFRAEMADAAVFLAGQVRKIGDLWRGFNFNSPVEYEQKKE
ncbi:MAG: hypothetical protein G01um101470_938 [Parcubacteria group bacterium Gr01-1014_70]|nr:MAG: hypothetical protein G01um101470_938 [Parcubacteria group bacterium Gr01-1014_70]